jgi:sortase A
VLLVVGLVAMAYAAAVIFWRDPVTDLWARWKQHELAGELTRSFDSYRGALAAPAVVPEETAAAPSDEVDAAALAAASAEEIARRARVYVAGLELGQPLGRIVVPKLGIDPVFVHGTRWGADLSRGPGHYERTTLPGLGGVTAIAGHRTTFGAPFRHIDDLKAGDPITLELAYGTFRYVVFSHEIVEANDWSIIEPRGFDLLVLSACHPLYSASQRWIVYARLVSVEVPKGVPYRVAKSGAITPA